MDTESLVAFLRSQHWAVEATVSTAVQPGAVVDDPVTNPLERVFDYTVDPPRIVERRFPEHGVLRSPPASTQTDPR